MNEIPAQEKILYAIDYILCKKEDGCTWKELKEMLRCSKKSSQRIINLIISMRHEFFTMMVLYEDGKIKIFLK